MDYLVEQLVRDEGLRLKPYTDTAGKLTIGVGRNLTDQGITAEEARALLQADVASVRSQLQNFSWYQGLDPVRQGVVENMTFNLGLTRMFQFTRFLAALRLGRWEDAAEEMLKSEWRLQVGERADRLAQQIRTGEWQ